jgi:hypothetical protein
MLTGEPANRGKSARGEPANLGDRALLVGMAAVTTEPPFLPVTTEDIVMALPLAAFIRDVGNAVIVTIPPRLD